MNKNFIFKQCKCLY